MEIAAFENGFLQLLSDMEQRSEDSKGEYANRFTALLHALILSVKVQAGIPVSTTGSAAAQQGVTTAEGSVH